jgi:glutaminyl-peptide cyclotransferase
MMCPRTPAFVLALVGLLLACNKPTAWSPGAEAPALTATGDASGFDSSRAFEHIRQLVAIGPRPPGSAGIQQARTYIMGQLTGLGLAPIEQTFEADTPLGPIKMANVIVRIPGARTERLLIAGHYDTKLFRQFRFVGANDGGSSTAMLLELARVLKERKNPLTIELVFFDGEEALVDWTGTDHTYGSRHYVDAAKQGGTFSSILAMVLVDMVGDRQLTIRRESYSTRWLTNLVWATAKGLGRDDIFLDEELPVEDDHRVFLDAGVPSLDIIDMTFPAHHKPEDNLDAVSARSLQIVGDVVLAALPKIEARLSK